MAMVALPGAKAEGEAVAKQFAGATLLTGKEATKERLLTEGGKSDLLHIATHGYADPEIPEFSGLLLSSPQSHEDTKEHESYDVLTAQEVFLWNLQAKLVTLSACETGLGKDVEGEGVLGLTRAFLYAGAKDIVCSLWSVSDESTRRLMQQMYAGMQKGMPVEAALQAAQQTLLQDPTTRHPFYWAAFIEVRGPR
jgi:CHAT domain-containing protein